MSLSFGSKALIGTIAAGSIGAGVIGRAAPAVRDGAMEAAFGDPNADAAFLGDKLSPSTLMSTAMPAPVGGTAVGMMGAGGVVGGALGYGGVSTFAKSKRKTIANAVSSIGETGKRSSFGGPKARVAGAIAGAVIGAAAAPSLYTTGHVRRNSNFYSQSPYNTSLNRAEQLNASGDIVLGMFNSRG
jgi:hypothetical protein